MPDVFREKVYINIREYYLNKRESEEEEEEEDDEEENTPYLFPTKKGVCFTEEEFNVFSDKIARVKSLVKRLKKEKTNQSFGLAAQQRGDPRLRPANVSLKEVNKTFRNIFHFDSSNENV